MSGALVCALALAGIPAGLLCAHAARLLVGGKPGAQSSTLCALACAACFAVAGLSSKDAAEAVELCVLSSVLVTCSATDLEAMRIPNVCVAVAVMARLGYLMALATRDAAAARALAIQSAAGLLVVALPLTVLVLIMDHVLGRPSMGGGDLKLFAVAGLYLGVARAIVAIMASCVFGVIFALVRQALAAKGSGPSPSMSADFPFGPSIAAGIMLALWAGNTAVGWYLGPLM